MKVFACSQARQNLFKVLNIAREEEVTIHRRDGSTFSIVYKGKKGESPFDVDGIKTKVTTGDIVDAVRESRKG